MPTSSKNIKHVLIGGAKGVGKSTLISSPLLKDNYNAIIFSNLLKSYAKEIFGKSFIKLDMGKRDILRKQVVEKLGLKQKMGIYIWEVHFCCYEFGRKRSVIPENLLEKASGIIFITLDEIELKRRRMMDKNKKRSYLLKTIKRDSRIELEYAEKASKKFNIPLFLYKNDSLANEIGEVLAKIIK